MLYSTKTEYFIWQTTYSFETNALSPGTYWHSWKWQTFVKRGLTECLFIPVWILNLRKVKTIYHILCMYVLKYMFNIRSLLSFLIPYNPRSSDHYLQRLLSIVLSLSSLKASAKPWPTCISVRFYKKQIKRVSDPPFSDLNHSKTLIHKHNVLHVLWIFSKTRITK